MSNMDDNTAERTLKIKINGTEYAAAPFGTPQVMALQMVKSVSGSTVIKILGGLVLFSLGEDAQTEVLIQMATGDLDEHGLIKILMDIAKASSEKKEAEENTVRAGAIPRASKPPSMLYGDDAETRNPLVPDTFTGGRD